MQTPLTISGISSISALGISEAEIWNSYISGKSLFSKKEFNSEVALISEISMEGNELLSNLSHTNPAYKKLDRSVLLAMFAAIKAFDPSVFRNKNVGVNIGSSRGATGLFEKYHSDFLKEGKVSLYTSPNTTLGNISSWVGQELGVNGINIEHSVTCSTALHAMLNGIAWLQADMADAFVVGGSEAALTPFTLAQMRALKLYSNSNNEFACESMDFQKKRNTMVLGEAAAVAVLEKGITDRTQAVIRGYGYASEKLMHNSSISENALCFQHSMRMALQKSELQTVDAIVMHAPGTVKGDQAELNAIIEVFGDSLPLLTSNKWLVGHTFAASGMLSVQMALMMLSKDQFIENPFYRNQSSFPKHLKSVMVNAVGFGGNAVSIIVTK